MPVETPFYFAQIIQDHIALKQRNSELERAMPIDRYKEGDPFNNHPLFKTEEQARLEDTMENVVVEAHMVRADALPPLADEGSDALPFDDGEQLWSRSRDFDWGD